MPHAIFLTVTFLALATLPAPAIAGDPLEDAKSAITRNAPKDAVRILEDALPEIPKASLPAFLATLRDAYTAAIAQADAEGKSAEAAPYRDGLNLIAKLAPSPVTPSPSPLPPTKPAPVEAKPPVDARPPAPQNDSELKVADATIPAPEAKRTAPVETLEQQIAVADRAWVQKRYIDAGEAYAKLEQQGKLPAHRRDHWAYCRLVAVLDKINAQPRTPGEWTDIYAEIDHIRILSPKNWYSEYLRNVVVERSGGVKKNAPDQLVVRGAAPDEPSPTIRAPRVPALTKPISRDVAISPQPAPPIEPAAPPIEPAAPQIVGRAGRSLGRWKTWVTPNFQIFHDDETLAKDVAIRAEAARIEIATRWTGAEPTASWTPRCDIYLYPTAEIFAQETQQPPDSPGFSTAGLGGGRVTARIVKLRVDFPKMRDAVLPHELTHIVLADLFATQQIPRWADEGMAVLSEPEAEQALRANDLATPLANDVLFTLEALMTSDYPGGEHWALYYAQSVSLTRYLVGLGTPSQFAGFVKKSQTAGIDVALREAYGVEGLAELEPMWKAHAKQTAASPAKSQLAKGAGSATVR